MLMGVRWGWYYLKNYLLFCYNKVFPREKKNYRYRPIRLYIEPQFDWPILN